MIIYATTGSGKTTFVQNNSTIKINDIEMKVLDGDDILREIIQDECNIDIDFTLPDKAAIILNLFKKNYELMEMVYSHYETELLRLKSNPLILCLYGTVRFLKHADYSFCKPCNVNIITFKENSHFILNLTKTNMYSHRDVFIDEKLLQCLIKKI